MLSFPVYNKIKKEIIFTSAGNHKFAQLFLPLKEKASLVKIRQNVAQHNDHETS